ncbi:LysR family transcriptional regulator [Oxalobacteraceae bacterium OM1]|nr:LysR family transcriptional regulator [Oxalobacteraceae bacterium OM1]
MPSTLLHLPPLDALRGFVAVARRMSITLAADDLCLTQSAVSRQVQALEAHLKTPLFVRKHRALALTKAGEQLFQLTDSWMERLSDYVDEVRHGERPRPVTITASIGVTALWILPRLGTFQAAHPHIDVRVAANNRLLDLSREGIDLAIRYCRESQAPRSAVRLFEERIVPVANPAVAARAFRRNGLLQQVFLELDDRTRPWLRWSDWLKVQGMEGARPTSTLHFNQYDQVIQAALEGHGVALGRVGLVAPMLQDGRLVAQPGTEVACSDYAYWLVQADDAPRADVALLRDWLVAEVARMPDGMR